MRFPKLRPPILNMPNHCAGHSASIGSFTAVLSSFRVEYANALTRGYEIKGKWNCYTAIS